jgi:hypothetical protein
VHEAGGGAEHVQQLFVPRFTQTYPGRDGYLEQRLGFPFVAYSGNERLVQEGLAELSSLVRLAKAFEHGVESGRAVHDVRAEASQLRGSHLENRPVSLHGLPRCGAQNEPRPAQNGTVGGLHEPASTHAQVAADDKATLECEEEVLAPSLHVLQTPSVDLLRDSEQGGAWVRRLRFDHLTLQHPETLGGPMEAVTLGHDASGAKDGPSRAREESGFE